MITFVVVVLLLLILFGVTAVTAVALSVRGRVMALDAKVTVICDELGVVVPVVVGYEENGEEQADASQITR